MNCRFLSRFVATRRLTLVSVQLQLVELQLMLPPGGINPPRVYLDSPPFGQLIAQNSFVAIRSIQLSLIDLPSG